MSNEWNNELINLLFFIFLTPSVSWGNFTSKTPEKKNFKNK